ncbi:MAG: rRNA pseudouridine synthase [Bdellovibrionales bacterium]|nr:rRNA pseudouridine synthase [Bdellovibrionales bacterium]
MSVRLNKFLALCGVSSRRGAEELIEEGRVRVNGTVVTELGIKVDPARDTVKVGNRVIRPQQFGVLLFHKPKNVVSTLSDPEKRPCIGDYLGKNAEGYFPVGRLDFESTGLVILTNDGDMADRLLHPRYGFDRNYEVRVAGVVGEKTLRRLNRGVRLSDGPIRADVTVQKLQPDSTWLKVSLSSGKKRIIRRLMEHVHHPVLKLHRVSHGPFHLGKVRRGEMLSLPEDKYKSLRERVFNGSGK